MTAPGVPAAAPDGVPVRTATGTPFPLPPDDAALETLEFAAVLARVAGYATGPLGAASVQARRPSADRAWAAAELALVGEALALERRGEGIRAAPVPPLQPVLARLRVDGSVLDVAELLAVSATLTAARTVASELRRVAEEAPAVAALLRELPPRTIDDRLARSFDDDGDVADGASPGLARARQAVREARARLVRRLETLLQSLDGGQGGSVTMRNGRYVIPVRRDDRSRPDGLIHGESASQGTLYLEPSPAIELGNALAEAESAEAREVLAVLRELTGLVRPEARRLADAHGMAVQVDDLVARTRWAHAVGGEVPTLVEAPGALRITGGRHPLLLGGTMDVVPFDLALDAGQRTVLVSGPNTGGKTVLLKAVGLAALLAQSGIVPPVGAGTVLPVYARVFADIGDHQSIAASLSTFSAHVAELRRVLDGADGASLVLLDETGGGTDPAEGAALAAAALASLTARGAQTLATTHLGALKSLPEQVPGMVSASLEFDEHSLAPTYRFRLGLPGRSYGLAIARRLGVSPEVVADAERRVPEAERMLDALLARAEARGQELQLRLEALEAREAEASARLANLEAREAREAERREALDLREREADRQGREAARQHLLDARRLVEDAIAQARRAQSDGDARDARRQVEEAIRTVRATEDAAATRGGVAGLAVGQAVRIPGGGLGEVVEVRGDGRVAVAVGSVRMVVDAAQLEPAPQGAGRPRRMVVTTSAPETGAEPASELDLRGCTAEEAEQAVLAAIDRAVLADQPFLRVIHGKGTGVLRERVQALAQRDRRVRHHALAPAAQGGSGVTIIELAP